MLLIKSSRVFIVIGFTYTSLIPDSNNLFISSSPENPVSPNIGMGVMFLSLQI